MFGIKKDLKIHFVGIGGIGMSGIANILLNLGYPVSGSDLSENDSVRNLKESGATVFSEHLASNVEDAQLVVYSSAINSTNPEIRHAHKLNIPIIKRAEMLAELMRLKYGIAIAGSHGKTTTTSFISTIFSNLDQKPTCIVGGVVKNLKSQAVKGDGQYLIAEADESDGSFLFLNPIMSIITNIDNDHLDFYGTEEKIKEAFVEFINKIPFYGKVAINFNDKNSCELIPKIRRPYVGYAIKAQDTYSQAADYVAENIAHTEDGTTFDVVHGNLKYSVQISLSGNHNVQNALGAIAISHQVGLELKDVCAALANFSGVGRRFEILLKTPKMILVDDYGHHPTEITATIETAKVKYPNKKIIVVFEPHRYTRTKDFWKEFVNCFSDVEKVFISPIYPASEKEIEGINSIELVKSINSKFHNAKEFSLNDDMNSLFDEYEHEDAVILSLGAGSISRVTRSQIEKWKS